jgi:DNA mismatch repair protein MutS
MNLPPMIAQYWAIKKQYENYLILFRVGDFFELFYEDAIKASGILNITLTKKSYGKGDDNQDYPMCGIPHHSYLHYCYKLVMAGNSVVICDQMETPEEAKAAKRPVVKREVTKILTKSTIYYENFSFDDFNHFLVSIGFDGQQWMLLMADIATNDFFYKVLPLHQLDIFLGKINPEEILIGKYDGHLEFIKKSLENYKNKISLVATVDHIPLNNWWQSYKNTLPHWQQIVVNTLVSYLIIHGINMDNCQKIPINFPFQETMGLNGKTIKQLHLLPTTTSSISSIFQIIDHTQTPMGKRLLQQYLLFPSTSINVINDRQNKIKFFHDFLIHNNINLTGTGDLSKYLNNCLRKNIKPLELLKMAQGLQLCLEIFKILEKNHYPQVFNHQCYISSLIINTMENPVYIEEGKIIKSDNIQLLKDYGEKMYQSHHQLKNLTDKYCLDFKINGIKIKNDNKNGYFMECTKSQEKIINTIETFKIIQYGIGYVRFISQEFVEISQQKNSYQQLINQIQYNIFDQLVEKVGENREEIQLIIEDIAKIDLLKGLSKLINQGHWVFPQVNNEHGFSIEGGYHPLVKHYVSHFIANDFIIDKNNFHIVTGPNMGGKSTFLRQNAIIIILAQMGCPVPAKSAFIAIVDNIFTRIGADDNLLEGASTFMVEMEEMASMINNATPKSFLIIDELGRGTSVQDGIAIARAIIEFFITLKSSCLFSTHFHNLNEFIDEESVSYYHCGYKFDPLLQFTYKIEKGITHESFGIHVAQLAGIPKKIIDRAKDFYREYQG